jgi:hypothetical protein
MLKSSVQDQCVDSSVPRERGIDHGSVAFHRADIGMEEPVTVEVDAEHVRSFPLERFAECASQTSSRAGDDGYPILEPPHHKASADWGAQRAHPIVNAIQSPMPRSPEIVVHSAQVYGFLSYGQPVYGPNWMHYTEPSALRGGRTSSQMDTTQTMRLAERDPSPTEEGLRGA